MRIVQKTNLVYPPKHKQQTLTTCNTKITAPEQIQLIDAQKQNIFNE